jgi:hypothetical protein
MDVQSWVCGEYEVPAATSRPRIPEHRDVAGRVPGSEDRTLVDPPPDPNWLHRPVVERSTSALFASRRCVSGTLPGS